MSSFFYILLGFAALYGLIWMLSLSTTKRHLQWYSPLMAVMLYCTGLWLYLKPLHLEDLWDKVLWAITLLPPDLGALFLEMAGRCAEILNHEMSLILTAGGLFVFCCLKLIFNLGIFIYGVCRRGYRGVKNLVSTLFTRKETVLWQPEEVDAFFRRGFVYRIHQDGGCLLPYSWYFARLCFAWAFALGVLVFAFWLILLHTEGRTSWMFSLFPSLTGLFLLVLMELFLFFNGRRTVAEKAELPPSEEETEPREEDLERLWNEYRDKERGWGDWVLAARREKIPAVEKKGEDADKKDDGEDTWLGDLMQSRRIRLSRGQKDFAEKLWAGRDIILQASVFSEVVPVLSACLMEELMQQNRILVLVEEDHYGYYPAVEHTAAFLQEELGRIWEGSCFWTVSGLREAARESLDLPDILVTGVSRILGAKLSGYEKLYASFRKVIVMDMAASSGKLSELSVLAHLLRQHSKQDGKAPPSYLFFNHDGRRWESAIQSSLSLEPVECSVLLGRDMVEKRQVWQVVLRTESVNREGQMRRMQHVLSEHRAYMGLHPCLAFPVFRDRVRHVMILDACMEPWWDLREEVIRAQAQGAFRDQALKDIILPDYGRSVESTDAGSVGLTPLPWLSGLMARQDGAMLIMDQRCNLSECLSSFQRFLSGKRLMVITSPPHLFRAYMASNIAYLIHHPVFALAPKLLDRGRDSLARRLLEILLRTWMDGNALADHLGISSPLHVEAALNRLFKGVMDIDLMHNGLLEIERSGWDSFAENGEGAARYRYRVRLNRLVEDLPWRQVYWLKDGPACLGAEHVDRIHLHCLPGQIKVLRGKSYRVRDVDSQNYVVNIVHEDRIHLMPVYRFSRRILPDGNLLEMEVLHTLQRQVEGWTLRRTTLQGAFLVETLGYCEFPQGVPDFMSGLEYTPLDSGRSPSLFPRRYGLGRALLLEFSPPGAGNTGEERLPDLLCWLSLMLNEAFYTLFPENPAQILSIPLVSGSGMDRPGSGADGVPAAPLDLLPQAEGVKFEMYRMQNQKSIPVPMISGHGILVLEDSHRDMGFIQVLHDEWPDVADLLSSFVDWLEKNGESSEVGALGAVEKGKGFLGFGASGKDGAPLRELHVLLKPWLEGRAGLAPPRMEALDPDAVEEGEGVFIFEKSGDEKE